MQVLKVARDLTSVRLVHHFARSVVKVPCERADNIGTGHIARVPLPTFLDVSTPVRIRRVPGFGPN